MPCPILESGKIHRYCIKDDSEDNPCETCTWKIMDKRILEMYSDISDEAWERAKEEGNWYWDKDGTYHNSYCSKSFKVMEKMIDIIEILGDINGLK